MHTALRQDGVARAPFRLDLTALADLAALFNALPPDQPGARIDPRPLRTMPALAPVHAGAISLLGPEARPVRALLFDKRAGANWALGWHQDRTVEVAARIDVEGFGAFTVKQGRIHVAPPIAVVERMLTVRIHLDAVDADNGELVVAPGSHRYGYIAEGAIAAVVADCGEATCPAESGEVWFYATPILHRSARSIVPRRRRVLQLDYAHDPLPGGLRWFADV